MENLWNAAVERALQMSAETSPRRSERNGLVMVFRWAQEHGIENVYAEYAVMAPISNLQTASAELKRAVRWDDPDAIRRILHLCATRANADLRLDLRTVYLQDVPVEQVGGRVVVKLTTEQFASMRSAMKLRHRYVSAPRQERPALELGYDFYQ